MDERELLRTLLRGVICGNCGRPARIGPCVCSPAREPTPVKVEDLGSAIRERLDDGRDGDALRAVLDIHVCFFAELTGDGEVTGYQCQGCGPVEDWGSVHYPCKNVLAIAKAMGIEVDDA